MNQQAASQLATYERLGEAIAVMTDSEKADLMEWEKTNVTGDGKSGTSDWPGLAAIVKRISH